MLSKVIKHRSHEHLYSQQIHVNPHSGVFILAVQRNMLSSNMHRVKGKKLCSEIGLEKIGLFNHVVHRPDGQW